MSLRRLAPLFLILALAAHAQTYTVEPQPRLLAVGYNAAGSDWLAMLTTSTSGQSYPNAPPPAVLYGVNGSTYYPMAVDASGNLQAIAVAFQTGGTLPGSCTGAAVFTLSTTYVPYYCNGGTYSSFLGGGTTTNALTGAASGGAAPGSTFNGSAAVTFDYHTFGAPGLAVTNTYTAGNSSSVSTALYTGSYATGSQPFMLFQPTGTTAATNFTNTILGFNWNAGYSGNVIEGHGNGNGIFFKISSGGVAFFNGTMNAANIPISGTTAGDLTKYTDTAGTMADSGVVAANAVVASSPGVGIAHFAGSTQTVTSSAVSLTADVSGVLPQANGGFLSNTPTVTWTAAGTTTYATAGANQSTAQITSTAATTTSLDMTGGIIGGYYDLNIISGGTVTAFNLTTSATAGHCSSWRKPGGGAAITSLTLATTSGTQDELAWHVLPGYECWITQGTNG